MRHVDVLWIGLACVVLTYGCERQASPTPAIAGVCGRIDVSSIGGMAPVQQALADSVGPWRKASGIQWGGVSPFMSAQIVRVAVECYPETPHGRTGSGDHPSYEVAGTAWIRMSIADTTRFLIASDEHASLHAQVRLQLLSVTGVVLRESTESVQLTTSDADLAVSSRFAGLSADEARRARALQVFWLYGRQ